MKKPAVVSGAVLLAVVAVLVGSSSDGRAQMQIQPLNGWSYAYLANIHGSDMEVAYVEDGKCRIEKFYEPVNQPFRSDINFPATRIQSSAAAMTSLMRNRWDMVGEGFAYCHYPGDVTAIHFKRMR